MHEMNIAENVIILIFHFVDYGPKSEAVQADLDVMDQMVFNQ